LLDVTQAQDKAGGPGWKG